MVNLPATFWLYVPFDKYEVFVVLSLDDEQVRVRVL